jgi:hypothetical protein
MREWRKRNPKNVDYQQVYHRTYYQDERNKAAAIERAKIYYEANKSRILDDRLVKHRLKKYGLTPEKFEAMVAAQNGVCAICAEECSTGDALSVDHDHVTGAVRALLCRKCNSAIGMLRDSVELAAKALGYLKKYK